ncbi:MAG TPA: phosphoribosylformylglycinamidine synthase II, partial [Actinobacteria bacterium]|nr:phosphoribosylformylglycinamidine synthase II [Actinomycetota bacterium]
MGIPVTGGNVSFYNQTGETAILPTPIIGVLGVIADVNWRLSMELPAEGLEIFLLGTTNDELDGSEWAHTVHGHLGGRPPQVNLAAERALADVLAASAERQLVAAAHDISDGGLSQSLVEMALRGGHGVRISLSGDAFVELFSESVARAVVAVSPDLVDDFLAVATQHEVAVQRLGVSGGDHFSVDAGDNSFTIALDDLRAAHTRTLPDLFDH